MIGEYPLLYVYGLTQGGLVSAVSEYLHSKLICMLPIQALT